MGHLYAHRCRARGRTFQIPFDRQFRRFRRARKLKPGYIWFVTADFPDRVGKQLPLLLKESNIKSIALISNVLDFTKEVKGYLEPALKEQGIEVRVNEEYPPSLTDMTALLSKVKHAAPDGVIALAYPPDLYSMSARQRSLESPRHSSSA